MHWVIVIALLLGVTALGISGERIGETLQDVGSRVVGQLSNDDPNS